MENTTQGAHSPNAPDVRTVGLKLPRKLGRPLRRRENRGSRAPKFNWRGSPEGRAAKLLLYWWARERAGDDTRLAHTGDWVAFGVTTAGALDIVSSFLPWFPNFYSETMGKKPLTGQTLLNRVYYFFHTRTGRPSLSPEHPLRSPSLFPFNLIAQEVFARGKPLTREQVGYLFALPAKPVGTALAYLAHLDGDRPQPPAAQGHVPRTPLPVRRPEGDS